MGPAFMSFEFGKFGHCFGFRYSDFEFNILILMWFFGHKDVFCQKKHEF